MGRRYLEIKRIIIACIRNSGFSAISKASAFNKSMCLTESEILFKPLLLIYPTVGGNTKKEQFFANAQQNYKLNKGQKYKWQ